MANTYLTRTPSSNGNRRIWTFSAWVKVCADTQGVLMGAAADTSNFTRIQFWGSGDNSRMTVDTRISGTSKDVTPKRAFRDNSGWYHIVTAVDTTQATASNRVKIWINGVQETEFESTNYPDQNSDPYFNNTGYAMVIGNNPAYSHYFNGLMSHVNFVDGTAYQASDFGETDTTTGEWKIKTSPSVTYGTNGFFILKDGNSVTDQSGNGNNFTVGGGTLTNTEDCPSNVFCTLNPLNTTVSGTAPVFSNGNNTVVTGTSSADFGGSGTFGLKKGVWYYEGLVVTSGNDNLRSIFGITSNPAETARNNQEIYHNRYSYSWKGYNGAWWTNTNATNGNGTENVNYLNTYTNGDYIGIYFDLDNSKMLFTKNGTLERSGVSMSITAVGSTDTGFYFPIYTDGHSAWSSSAKLNFGNGSFGTTSLTGSENSDWFRDAGGLGKFKYNPTQTIDSTTWNARAICTKNINTYG